MEKIPTICRSKVRSVRNCGFQIRAGTLRSLAHGAVAAGMALTVPHGWAQAATEDGTNCEPCHVTESFLIELPFIQEKGTFQATVSPEYHSGHNGPDILAPL